MFRRYLAAVVSIIVLSIPHALRGQTTAGATFLLLSVSARAVGMGGATVADAPGSEGVESNPASLGWLTRREAALQYAQDFGATRFLAAVAVPTRVAGTFEVSWKRAEYGQIDARIGEDVPISGALHPRNDVFAASYGVIAGRRLALGVTLKLIRNDYFNCSGVCVDPSNLVTELPGPSSAGALDVGLQYDVSRRVPLRVGFALRHAGSPVQIRDREQADPLPTEASIGARVDVPAVARRLPGAELRLLGEGIVGVSRETTGEVRIGAEGVYRRAIALRAGYRRGRGATGGPAVGLGYTTKHFAFDLATQIGGFSSDGGKTPTFVALRFWP